MIVNHATGQQASLPSILRAHQEIIAPDHPERDELIAQGGYRTHWASSTPTDAELRLIGFSYVVETERPPGSATGPIALVDDVWTRTWVVLTDEQLRAQIIAQIKQATREHILMPLPEWRQANATARALQITRIESARSLTEPEQAELAALEAAWAWVVAVRLASDQFEVDVAAMTRAQLDAWTMPELPEWQT